MDTQAFFWLVDNAMNVLETRGRTRTDLSSATAASTLKNATYHAVMGIVPTGSLFPAHQPLSLTGAIFQGRGRLDGV